MEVDIEKWIEQEANKYSDFPASGFINGFTNNAFTAGANLLLPLIRERDEKIKELQEQNKLLVDVSNDVLGWKKELNQWKARCEAAEAVIESEKQWNNGAPAHWINWEARKKAYATWQDLAERER